MVRAGANVRPYLEPVVTLTAGTRVFFQARRLKQDLRPPPFCFSYAIEDLNPVHALATYLQACQVFGQPIEDILARVTAADRRCFLEKTMDSSHLTTRLRQHFGAVRVPYHVTTHGGRRGAIQALTKAGLPSEEIGVMSQIKTPAVRVCYQDERRHLPCLLPRVGRVTKGTRSTWPLRHPR